MQQQQAVAQELRIHASASRSQESEAKLALNPGLRYVRGK
jgi:hypothetical protein